MRGAARMLLKLQKPGEIFLNKNFLKIIMNLNDFFLNTHFLFHFYERLKSNLNLPQC